MALLLFPVHVTFMTVFCKVNIKMSGKHFPALRHKKSDITARMRLFGTQKLFYRTFCESLETEKVKSWCSDRLTLWTHLYINIQLAHTYFYPLISSFLYYLFGPQCALWAAGKQMSWSVKSGAFLSQIDVHVGLF